MINFNFLSEATSLGEMNLGGSIVPPYYCALQRTYLLAVNLHDQRPSTSSTCAHARVGHVTVNRDIPTISLKQVSIVSQKPDLERSKMINDHSRVGVNLDR